MILVPYEQLTIQTSLPAEEARAKLEQVTEPDRLLRLWWKEHKPYEGKIEGYHFTVSRIISYRNSFLPYITGQIQPDVVGCSIRITMHPHVLILLLMVIFFGGGGLVLLGSFITSVLNADADLAAVLNGLWLPVTILVSVYLLILAGFKFESAKSKTFFRQLFQANRVDEVGTISFSRKS